MTIRRTSMVLGACLACLALFSVMANAAAKKLIEYGWGTPHPSYIVNNIRQMEQQGPFDGIAVDLTDHYVFETTPWPLAQIQPEINALAQIKWQKFTDNFVATNISAPQDWYSDANWTTICANAQILAKAALNGHCKGIIFDPEPYRANAECWWYTAQAHTGTYNFAAYQAQVRKRGAQFLTALQQAFPRLQVFMLMGDSMVSYVETMGGNINTALPQDSFGLLPSFVNGMLDVASPGTVITDGHENPTYWYNKSTQFLADRTMFNNLANYLVPPEDQTKYYQNMKLGESLYSDWLFNMVAPPQGKPSTANLSATERLLLAQSNVYYALKCANKYAWLWDERVNWWTNQNVPAGFATAIQTAEQKVNSGQALGFSADNLAAKM